MTYRNATLHEAETIADLHARSWQTAYQGILSDDFLEKEVIQNRRELWQKRFENPLENVFLYVAEENDELKGFVCVYANDDEQWGSLVDNLHVLPEVKGQGVGKQLIQKAASWVIDHYPDSKLYLWVYEKNHKAIGFYEKMGGKNVGSQVYENPGGGYSTALRYAWADAHTLLEGQYQTHII